MPIEGFFLAAVRGVHALATILWLGGGLFYLLVLRPALAAEEGTTRHRLAQTVGDEFRRLVQLAVFALIVSGVILTVNRLTSGRASTLYVSMLGAKVGVAVVASVLALRLRAEAPRRGARPQHPSARLAVLILALGILAVFLAALLKVAFEADLRR